MNKLDDLRARTIILNPDIIIISEVYPKTGDSTDIFHAELNISGYNCFKSNATKSSRGVLNIVKDFISAELRIDLSSTIFLESVWVDIKINEKEKNSDRWNLQES